MRRYPHELFSRARRSTNPRIERAVGGPPGPLGAGDARVMSGAQVAVPAAHGFRAHGQSHPAQHVAREPVE